MGRITSYDQDGHMVADFDKGECDLIHGWVGAEMERLRIENGKLRELVDGLTWCAERECGSGCPLYDKSESDHCRERRLKRELGIEADA